MGKWTEAALRMRPYIEKAVKSLPDEEAQEVPTLFTSWKVDYEYVLDERIECNGLLYKCVQAHTSQEDWTPDATPALWVRIWVEEWPEWVQPIGAVDAYAAGAKVAHNGQRWISTVDANVWEPGVYGWEPANSEN